MKTIIVIFLCNIIIINFINADYPDQKCYICDQTNGCNSPGSGYIKSCSITGVGGTSGKSFVSNALIGTNNPKIYESIYTNLSIYAQTIGLDPTIMPSWENLTRWVNFL